MDWQDACERISSIAARHRAETDPLVEALEETGDDEAVERAWRLRAMLAKRGFAFTKCDPERLPV